MTLPEGYVDPADRAAVATVFEAVLRTMGTEGVLDLLARMPGVRRTAAAPKRFLSPAVPGSVWVGEEDRLALDPTVGSVLHEQVVGGVVLHRSPVPPGALPTLLADLTFALARAQGSHDEVGTVLTAAREAAGSF